MNSFQIRCRNRVNPLFLHKKLYRRDWHEFGILPRFRESLRANSISETDFSFCNIFCEVLVYLLLFLTSKSRNISLSFWLYKGSFYQCSQILIKIKRPPSLSANLIDMFCTGVALAFKLRDGFC